MPYPHHHPFPKRYFTLYKLNVILPLTVTATSRVHFPPLQLEILEKAHPVQVTRAFGKGHSSCNNVHLQLPHNITQGTIEHG